MTLKALYSSSLTLVIDQGSHASRLAVFTETGELVYLKSTAVSTHAPENSGIYEQDALAILYGINGLLNELPEELLNNIKTCGLCTQRSTVVAWHRTSGKALAPAISWRDTRAQKRLNQLVQNSVHSSARVRSISGLPLSAHYSASKIHWLLHNNTLVKQANQESQLCISPLASYLLFHLLQDSPVIIDHSNAQRCQLFDYQSLDWSDELLELFQLSKAILPECVPVMHSFGKLKLNNIPVSCVCGDQNAALYAYPELQKDSALINIGTGAFILSPSAEKSSSQPALLHTLAISSSHSADYVTEGTVNGAGSSLSWAEENDACEKLFDLLPQWLLEVRSPPVFINSISRLGSPWWCDAGKAEFIGKNSRYQNARYVAIIESILFLVLKNLQSLECPPTTLLISGGLSQFDTLCQKLADLLQTNVLRFNQPEASARGCAWLANHALKNSNLNWKNLTASQRFTYLNRQSEHREITQRYQQFVGELNRRCMNN